MSKNTHMDAHRRDAGSTSACMRGACLIKKTRGASKSMQVTLACTEDRLYVNLLQKRDGIVYTFQLCELWLSALVVGWLSTEVNVFAVAVMHKGNLHHSIFVYPMSKHRDEWLCYFDARRVCTAPFAFFEKNVDNMSRVSLVASVCEEHDAPAEQSQVARLTT
ncbi:MAG: hypothetical protein EBR51_05190 [Gammaproteobacteria bacterium]|nr:hypothetical protein [Gammaproteobacteria bacterium]